MGQIKKPEYDTVFKILVSASTYVKGVVNNWCISHIFVMHIEKICIEVLGCAAEWVDIYGDMN